MITTGDITRRVYDDCRYLGVPIFIHGAIPEGKVTDERIIIIPKTIEDGTNWYRGYMEVNYLVPDIKGEEDGRRLDAVERLLKPIFYGQGVIDGTRYRYRRFSIGREQDASLECHFVNVRLLIEIQKVIEL